METMLWKNPSSGVTLHTVLPLPGVLQEAAIGHLICWTFHQLRMGPSYQKGVRLMTEASWSKLCHGRPATNFGQSGAIFAFTL